MSRKKLIFEIPDVAVSVGAAKMEENTHIFDRLSCGTYIILEGIQSFLACLENDLQILKLKQTLIPLTMRKKTVFVGSIHFKEELKNIDFFECFVLTEAL